MKKIYITIAMALLLNVTVLAQGWPANYGGVMLQGFFWDSYRTNWDGYAYLDAGGQDYTWATMYGAGWQKDGDKITDRWALPNSTWRSLINHKNEIAPYIDLLWLPQSGSTICPEYVQYTGGNKTRPYREQDGYQPFGINYGDYIVNPDCMGFVPVFYFHHGLSLKPDGSTWTYYHNGQTLTPMSYFGTEAELKQLIREYKEQGSYAIEDVVANHRGGLSLWTPGSTTKIDFPTEEWTSPDGVTHTISWDRYDVCSDDESGEGLGGADSGGQGQWAPDIAHNRDATREKVKLYLRYLTEELGYAGYRLDYAQGMSGKNMADYMYDLQPTFAVGENWNMSQSYLESWINSTFRNDHYQCAAFDFPLKRAINVAFNYGSHFQLLNGYTEGNSGEYANMTITPLINDPKYRRYAITFVENHDTFKDLPTDDTGYKDRLYTNILEANAFILCMPGTPCLFYAHFMHPDWHDTLVKLIKARRTAGITNESTCVQGMQKIGSDGAKWIVTGNKGEICIMLGAEAMAQGKPLNDFDEVWSSDICFVGISKGMGSKVNSNVREMLVNGYPIISKGSGSYKGSVEVTVTPSNDECTLVYTTNGHTPQAGDNTITSATTLTFEENTTLKVGVLANGEVPVTSVETREYIITSAESTDNTIGIYIHDNNAPNIYVWGGDNDQEELGGYPGTQASAKVTVGGMEWWYVQVPRRDYSYNMILSWNGSKTPDINGITSDVFYIVNNGNPTNVTNTYLPLIENPTVSIDKATGTYEGSVTATLTASYSGATIVYTTNGNEPSAIEGVQVTGTTTVNFNETGNYTLRAGILKDGQVINEVARSYTINNGTAITGINIYVRVIDSNDAPVLYYWNDNTSATNVNLTFTQNYNGQTWYYHKIENLSTANIIFKHDQEHPDDWSKKTGDIIGLVSPGNYYFYYYPNGSGDRYEVAPGLYTKTDKDFVRLYIKSSTPNDYHLWMWSDSGSKFSSWPGSAISALDGPVKIGGEQWYVCPIRKSFTNKKFKFSQNGNSESNNYELNNDMFVVYPDYENVTNNYIVYLTEEEPTTATLPSCATPMSGCQYFYFENSGYVSPYVWGWNNTKVFTGHSWPGEALVEVAGTAPNGNIVYRWTYYGDGAPSSLIFSDNGNSQAPAQGAYEFVNGGYYTNSGLQGVVSGNVMTLAEVIKNGTVGETYTISNDLSIAYIHDGKYIFAKDDDGDALNVSRNASGKTVYNSMTGWKYDQSNWIEIILPEGQELGAADTAKFVNKTLLGQTIVGELKDNINPTIEVVARPIPSETKVYNPNTYVVANFMNSSVNNNYYLVTPQAQEYAVIEWAVYQNGKFYMPATSANNYGIFLEGAIAATSGNPYLVTTPLTSNDNGKVFELEVIIKKKTQATAPTGAPSLKVEVNGNDVSDEWEVAVISTKDLTHTAITDVNVDGNRELVRTRYVNLMGIESDRPFKGANIVVKEYSDGTRTATKMLKR